MSQWFLHPVGGYWTTGLVAIGLIAISLRFSLSRDRLDRKRRMTLAALRAAVLLLTLVALCRPTLVHSTAKRQTATLAILMDQSRSMSVADMFGGKSRWQAVRSVIDDVRNDLRALAEESETEIHPYLFDAELTAIDFERGDFALPSLPRGEQSALGAALEEIARREAGKRMAGILVLSDGAQRAAPPHNLEPQLAARRLAELGTPAITFTFGQSRGLGQTRDIAIRELLVNPTVYVKNDLAIKSTIRVDGYSGKKIPIQAFFEDANGEMRPVANAVLQPKKDGEEMELQLSHAPDAPGEYRLTLRVEPQEGELVTSNNQMTTFVTVVKGGLKALYLEGQLRTEQKFLRWSLDASVDIQVDYHLLKNREARQAGAGNLAWFQPGKYDVFVIGDLDASTFTAAELSALAERVADGAGLVMLGGFHTFGPGGYYKTPLAELLPIRMDDVERQRPQDPLRRDLHLPGPLTVAPSETFGRHFILSLADDPTASVALWRQLPPLEGVNRFRGLKPTARVLAHAAAKDQKGDAPLLIIHEVGGRVGIFAADSTWHWWMDGYSDIHRRFWRQLLLWAAKKDETSEGSVYVQLAQRRFAPNTRIEFSVGARLPDGAPATSAEFTATVTGPSGRRQPVNLARQNDRSLGSFAQTATPGEYLIEATATQDGVALGEARVRFVVYEQDIELDNAVADAMLMNSLAQITASAGGKSLAPEELTQWIKELRAKPQEMEVQIERKDTYWDRWPFFLVYVAIMATEWYLRKRWGLV